MTDAWLTNVIVGEFNRKNLLNYTNKLNVAAIYDFKYHNNYAPGVVQSENWKLLRKMPIMFKVRTEIVRVRYISLYICGKWQIISQHMWHFHISSVCSNKSHHPALSTPVLCAVTKGQFLHVWEYMKCWV